MGLTPSLLPQAFAMASQNGYLSATRHPWPCFLFLLPLLAIYEGGVFWLGGEHPEALRNGADAWLRWGLETIGLEYASLPPALIALFFLIWSYLRRGDRPGDVVGVVCGMGIETVVFALGLWALSRALGPLLDHFGIPMSWDPSTRNAIGNTITFLGAGLYEEVLFRLLIFSGLILVLRLAFIPRFAAIPMAACVSAVLFSGAHHLGPFGESFDRYVFLFRTLAGLYFAFVYQFRGFGVAVGAHALYDVVVGVAWH